MKGFSIPRGEIEALLILAERGMFKENEISEQAHASYEMLLNKWQRKVK